MAGGNNQQMAESLALTKKEAAEYVSDVGLVESLKDCDSSEYSKGLKSYMASSPAAREVMFAAVRAALAKCRADTAPRLLGDVLFGRKIADARELELRLRFLVDACALGCDEAVRVILMYARLHTQVPAAVAQEALAAAIAERHYDTAIKFAAHCNIGDGVVRAVAAEALARRSMDKADADALVESLVCGVRATRAVKIL